MSSDNMGSPSLSRGFTSPSTQSSLHEIALTLPLPRKQNVACDACRARKVKCVRLLGQDKCQHCQLKNCPCTHFVQQATNVKRRSTNPYKKRSAPTTVEASMPSVSSPVFSTLSSSLPTGSSTNKISAFGSPSNTGSNQTGTMRLIAYLLSPHQNPSFFNEHDFQCQFRSFEDGPVLPVQEDWGEIGVKLEDETFRIEFALDLVEVYFQICHTRVPLLNPNQFRSRFQKYLPHNIVSALPVSQNSGLNNGATKPVHPALLATVLAWGAKFSEHPILILDRDKGNGRSRIARALLMKAREIAEVARIHRIPSADHVVIALLLEPLQTLENTNDPDGFHHFWISCAVRHLFELGINHRANAAKFLDSETRGTLRLAWWMACLGDAYGAVFFRKKPIIEDDDYDIELLDNNPSTNGATNSQHQGVPASAQSQFHGWYVAAHAMARCVREMSRQLWRPSTEADGISLEQLSKLVEPLHEWRDEFLVRVGVPSNFQADWDFVAAVSACSSDAQYHVMWIILHNAVEEFGIRELNEAQNEGYSVTTVPNFVAIENLKAKVAEEAVHGALRIAGLAGVLTSNGYLRLDPNVLHFAVFTGGMLLARLGKPEVQNCVAGLKQYGFAFEEAFDQAAEMERIFNQSTTAPDVRLPEDQSYLPL